MSVFWEYFRKTLRFPLIWPDGYLSLLVKGGAQVLDQVRDDILEYRRQAMPGSCDSQYLDRIASGRGITRWAAEPDDLWRGRVVNAYMFNKTGGQRSCVQQLFAIAGIEAQIFEAHEIFEAAAAAGGEKLDGSWDLDGSIVLRDFRSIQGLPYVSWAEFAVKVDLATYDQWDAMGRNIVNEFKPARSVMVVFYGLSAVAICRLSSEYAAFLKNDTVISYPWCTPRLDGSWSLGTGGQLYDLGGELAVDGTWAVGGYEPVIALEKLRQCNIDTQLLVTNESVRADRYITAGLGEPGLNLNGGWQVGFNRIFGLSSTRMKKAIEIDSAPQINIVARLKMDVDYPASPQNLDAAAKLNTWHQLNGGWSLSQGARNVKIDGSWPVRREPGFRAEGACRALISIQAGLAAKLGSYPNIGVHWTPRVNGGWRVGPHHKVDGSWFLSGSAVLSSPKLCHHYKKLNGSWRIGECSKRLPFAFQPGPQSELQIIRRG